MKNLRSILEKLTDWNLHHMNKSLAVNRATKDILSLLPEASGKQGCVGFIEDDCGWNDYRAEMLKRIEE